MKTPNRLLYFTLVGLISIVASSMAAAQITHLLTIPGVTGSATIAGYDDAKWMEIEGFGFNAYRFISPGGISDPEASSLTIHMAMDSRSLPKLFELAVSSQSLGDAAKGGSFRIDTINTQDSQVGLIKLAEASVEGTIESFSVQGSTGDLLFVEITVKLKKLRFTTKVYDAQGQPAGGDLEAGWDFENNVAL